MRVRLCVFGAVTVEIIWTFCRPRIASARTPPACTMEPASHCLKAHIATIASSEDPKSARMHDVQANEIGRMPGCFFRRPDLDNSDIHDKPVWTAHDAITFPRPPRPPVIVNTPLRPWIRYISGRPITVLPMCNPELISRIHSRRAWSPLCFEITGIMHPFCSWRDKCKSMEYKRLIGIMSKAIKRNLQFFSCSEIEASYDQISLFEISANWPFSCITANEAATKPVDVREFSTISTGELEISNKSSTNRVDLELATALTPRLRSIARFRRLPAVANTSIPRDAKTWQAANPTPPAPAWIKARLIGDAHSIVR